MGGTRFGCAQLIEVGDSPSLADARIMDKDFHQLEVYETPRFKTKGGVSRPILIGPNAWVGAGAIVLKGVRIGDNSVVGAGAVVANDIQPNVVVFGNPAWLVWPLEGPSASSTHREPRVATPVETTIEQQV